MAILDLKTFEWVLNDVPYDLQDGTVEEGVCSKVLVPDLFLDEYEYFCGDFVDRPKSSSSLVNGDTSNEVGVVQKVDRAARICTVQWLQIFHSEDQDE